MHFISCFDSEAQKVTEIALQFCGRGNKTVCDTRKVHATQGYNQDIINTYHFLDFNRGGGFLGIRKSALMGCMSQSAEGKKTKPYRYWFSCSLSMPWLQLPQTFPPSQTYMQQVQAAIQLNWISPKWQQFHSSMCQWQLKKRKRSKHGLTSRINQDGNIWAWPSSSPKSNLLSGQ